VESRGARRGKRRAARADRRAGDRARRRRPAARGAGDMRARGLGLAGRRRARARARRRRLGRRRLRCPPASDSRSTCAPASTRAADPGAAWGVWIAAGDGGRIVYALSGEGYSRRAAARPASFRLCWKTARPCARVALDAYPLRPPGDINRLELTREQPGALRPADQPRALGLAAVEPAGRGACGGAAGDLAQRERLGIRHAVPRLTAHPLQRSPRAATVVTMNPRFFSAASAGAVVHHDLARRRARPGPRRRDAPPPARADSDVPLRQRAPEDADRYRLDLSVTPEQFAGPAALAARNGYTGVSLDDVYRALRAEPPAGAPVVLTFETATRTLTSHLRLLRQHAMTGTFFVVTEWLTSAAPAT